MQRRRKKKATAAARKPGAKLDKSLPSLPPSMEETQSIDESPSEVYAEAADIQIAGPDASTGRESSPPRETATGKEGTTQPWMFETDNDSPQTTSSFPLVLTEAVVTWVHSVTIATIPKTTRRTEVESS
jgi:hypothetical protein